jgi:hypothetical protein
MVSTSQLSGLAGNVDIANNHTSQHSPNHTTLLGISEEYKTAVPKHPLHEATLGKAILESADSKTHMSVAADMSSCHQQGAAPGSVADNTGDNTNAVSSSSLSAVKSAGNNATNATKTGSSTHKTGKLEPGDEATLIEEIEKVKKEILELQNDETASENNKAQDSLWSSGAGSDTDVILVLLERLAGLDVTKEVLKKTLIGKVVREWSIMRIQYSIIGATRGWRRRLWRPPMGKHLHG